MSIEKFQPSYDIYNERMEHLKSIVPEAFADGKINWDILKEALGNFVEEDEGEVEHYMFTWPGKRQARRLAGKPPQGTLVPAPGEGLNEETTENIFIEGDNLEVLKLLQKSYAGKIKMIYIDPPYNTGNDFIYNDHFTTPLDEYLKLTGQIDEKGSPLVSNKKADGRFHSKWLNMMYPRLKLALTLLKEDGLIFISIDDNEEDNLKKICNEIFGEENFVGCIVWNSTKSVTNTALISVSHNFNFVYARDLEYFKKNRSEFRLPEYGEGFSNPDNDDRGPWKADPYQVGGWRPNQQYEIVNPNTGEKYKPNPGCSWKNDFNKYRELLEDNRIVFGVTGEAGPQRKRFLNEAEDRGKVSKTWWDDVGTTTNGTQTVKSLFDGKKVFSNPKPVDLIERLIMLGDAKQNGLILDFFAGSSSSAHAVLSLKFKQGFRSNFIMVQIPEAIDQEDKDNKEAVEFCQSKNFPINLAELSKERIRRSIVQLEKEHADASLKSMDLGFKVFKLQKSHFKEWQDYKGSDVNELMNLFAQQEDTLVEGWKPENLIIEIILQQGFPLHSKINSMDAMKDNKVIQIKSEFCNHMIFICLDKNVNDKTINDLPLTDKDIFICLDKALTDQQKVSLSDKGVIKTI